MTAVDLDARERLAVALPGFSHNTALLVADALLPVVQALVAEGAARELRAAAEAWRSGRANPDGLDDRADALDPS